MPKAQYSGSIAALYNSGEALTHPMNKITHTTWLTALGSIRGKYILDLACGGGHSSRLLAVRGAHVTGVDISPDMVKHAQEIEAAHPLGIDYLVGDAAVLHLDQAFDIVTPSFLFHYASTKDEMRRYMRAVYRHLMPHGRMVALHAWTSLVPRMNNAGHWSELVDPIAGLTEGARIRMHILDKDGKEVCPIEYYHWEQDTYTALLHECGFTNVRRITHQVPPRFRRKFSNWSQLEHYNASCVLTAEKH